MRKKMILMLSSLVMVLLLISSCQKDKEELFEQPLDQTDLSDGEIITGEYIIVFNDNTFADKSVCDEENYEQRQLKMRTEVQNMFRERNIPEDNVKHVYSKSMFGFSAKLSKSELELLKGNSDIKGIYPNRMVVLGRWDNVDPDPVDQVIPWGITRVNGGVDGTGLVAWIIDTGIDLDHPDLNVDASRGANFDPRVSTPDDDAGHGSHCAGTIAAIDNEIGVVGVAANATVIPVKVLDKRGRGSFDQIIAGVDFVAANGQVGDVANMSLGGGVYEPIDLAVYNASEVSGVKFVLAAGNESDDANNHSPARVNGPNIYTISAMAEGDLWASFSNYGNPPIDYCAPGVNIFSTYKSGGYTTMQGTSMAAPHAAGVILLGNWTTDGYVINDPDGEPDPIIVH